MTKIKQEILQEDIATLLMFLNNLDKYDKINKDEILNHLYVAYKANSIEQLQKIALLGLHVSSFSQFSKYMQVYDLPELLYASSIHIFMIGLKIYIKYIGGRFKKYFSVLFQKKNTKQSCQRSIDSKLSHQLRNIFIPQVVNHANEENIPIRKESFGNQYNVYTEFVEHKMLTIKDIYAHTEITYHGGNLTMNESTYMKLQDIIAAKLPDGYRLIYQTEAQYFINEIHGNSDTFVFYIESTKSKALEI